jgi:hypothetical protein
MVPSRFFASLLIITLFAPETIICTVTAFTTPEAKTAIQFLALHSSVAPANLRAQPHQMQGRFQTQLWSMKNDQDLQVTNDEDAKRYPEEVNEYGEARNQLKSDLPLPLKTEMDIDEGMGSDSAYCDIKLSKEDLTITDDNDLRGDNLMNMLRSELGIQGILQNSGLEKLNEKNAIPRSTELPLDVLLQRTLDTFEDVAVHLRRMPYEMGKQELNQEEDQTRKTVVLLGSGWAGVLSSY